MFVKYISTLSFQSLGGKRAAEKGIQRGPESQTVGIEMRCWARCGIPYSPMFPQKRGFLFTDHKAPPLSGGECH